MIHIQKQYEYQIEAIEIEREKFSKRAKYLPLMRFLSFLLSFVMFYNHLIFNNKTFVYLAVASLLSFVLLTLWDNLLKGKIVRSERLIKICRNEIKSMNGDFSPFESGDEYINPDHSYSYDLDIFGKESLFHCINRSVTIFGKNRLAEYFSKAYDFKNQIFERQNAVAELSEKIEFRQQMQLVFFGQKSVEKDRLEFNEWLESENNLLQNRLFNVIRFGLPIITNVLIILSLLGLVVVQIPIMMIILQLLIVSIYGRKTLKVQSLLTSKVGIISKYAQLLLLIEKRNFKAPLLVELKSRLSHDGIETPATIIKQLSVLLNWMDSNLNIIAAVILNGLFLFNLQLLAAVEKWKTRYREVIPRWYEIIGEFDALSSLANFTCNNPDYIFPELVGDQFFFEASDLGHPLIQKAECVTNNITISGWNQYCIITGANMSGKSTFLRTVGTNYVLAMIGSPVFASKFIFYPIILHSSIRTNDSLARKESFFYAELKRLKEIISELEIGQRTFILLDEILKGTNSKDKQAGSIALLEQLIKYQSVGLIATHDLILGELIINYPENIRNLCFEIKIVDDEMSIDYKLQDGVCKNLNATYLMKKMGILIDK
ncbi:MAG: hypothetical protein NTY07_14150 [Bacteroidia bacterium]|nr:hypothetical protein [Bacteroidia bacterium]